MSKLVAEDDSCSYSYLSISRKSFEGFLRTSSRVLRLSNSDIHIDMLVQLIYQNHDKKSIYNIIETMYKESDTVDMKRIHKEIHHIVEMSILKGQDLEYELSLLDINGLESISLLSLDQFLINSNKNYQR